MRKILFSVLALGAVSGLTGTLQSAKADDDDDRADRAFSVRDLRGS